ncbi:MAG: 23S rRNA (uracil(1939)-C(5))-methyltransferase RlmD [Bacteroidales bacterium]|nr:23S rRNA (uracil(1939)-C(5))-methyltransferase RlmD [Bacteroidales bacterium]
MSRKNKKKPLLESVEITAYAAEGKCVARVNEKVLFVPFAAVGDVADIQVTKSRSSYSEGRIVNLKQPSSVRVNPMCEHFGVCGGCKWQHVPYEEQLKFKQQQVMDALTRIGKVSLPECHPIDGSRETSFYRNKLEFTFSAKRWLTFEEVASNAQYDDMTGLGFHIPDSFDKVLDIKKCWLQDDISNQIRLEIRKFGVENNIPFYDLRNQHGVLRNMVVRTASTGEIMLIIIFGENDQDKIALVLDHMKESFPQITSLMYVVNTKCNDSWSDQEVHCWSGKDHIFEEMEGLKFKVGPKSFYQTNSRQAYELYKYARTYAGLNNAAEGSQKPLVYDLYTGTGTIANFVSRSARQVIGIEYVPDAIADAKVNSSINGIDNTLFYAGDMKDILTDDFIAEHGRPDVIITDPPRAGMHEDVVNVILNAEPKVIVYVSCNPATQARDLQLLDVKYRVTDIQPVDMFPHTQHVENVVRLELK